MGHAIHFLERLERLSMPQADLALALYRDPDLVRYRPSKYRSLSAAACEVLHGYWQGSWALGHLVGLHGTVLRELAAPLVRKLPIEEQQGIGISWHATRTMSTLLPLLLPWVIEADLEQLYFPAESLARMCLT